MSDVEARNQEALLSLDLVKLAGPDLAELHGTITCTVIGCPNQQEDGDLCQQHADDVRDRQPFEALR